MELQRVNWQNRAHFLAMVARLMRRVLVDAARTRQADKRGGEMVRVTFDEALAGGHDPAANWSRWTKRSRPWRRSTIERAAWSSSASSAD